MSEERQVVEKLAGKEVYAARQRAGQELELRWPFVVLALVVLLPCLVLLLPLVVAGTLLSLPVMLLRDRGRLVLWGVCAVYYPLLWWLAVEFLRLPPVQATVVLAVYLLLAVLRCGGQQGSAGMVEENVTPPEGQG